jgi:carbonic anhydrase
MCGGLQQSPIDINSIECPSEQIKCEKELKISGWYDIPINTTVEHNGITVEIRNIYAEDRPTMTGGPLGDEVYIFHQAHFHWGRNYEYYLLQTIIKITCDLHCS